MIVLQPLIYYNSPLHRGRRCSRRLRWQGKIAGDAGRTGADWYWMEMDIGMTFETALEMEGRYLELVQDLPRVHKGVRASEMLFLCATVSGLKPTRFLESGTAGGQSTIQLAMCYPEAEIVSYDVIDSDSYAKTARERLAPFSNVELRYGDSRRKFSELVREGDVVIIDGPKGFKALRFAFELLGTGKPSAVFLHDMGLGRAERRFMERNVRSSFFSDDAGWVARFGYLDTNAKKRPGEEALRQAPRPGTPPVEAFGGTFGCVPGEPGLSWWRSAYLVQKRGLARFVHLIPEKVFGRPPAHYG